MKQERLALINEIDKCSKAIAEKFANGQPITEDVLRTIIELYSSAQVERVLADEYFEAAYHAPVTGELELFIARILYRFSEKKTLKWKILLRRQEAHTAPDIRILKDGKTISIIEIKAKGGWIQPFLSPERYESDKKKHNEKNHPFNPDDIIARQQNQISKYATTFGLAKSDIYFFLPTLALVHRKKYETDIQGYYKYFSKTSKLSSDNFILLSENRRLDLAHKPDLNNLQPTGHLERMIKQLQNK